MPTLSRRTFLRGSGVALGLPLLNAMLPARVWSAPALAVNKRVAFLYVPNGIVHDAWKPVTTGVDYELPYSLEPLRPIKSDVNVLTGLSQIPYGEKKGVGHAQPTAALLTGKVPSREKIEAGKSIDQLIADQIGGDTKLKSLELSIAGSTLNGRCDGDFSCAYSSMISYRNPTSPMPTDNNPVSVFKRLFGESNQAATPAEQSRQAQLRQSVLDSVLEDARRLHRELGKSDQHKLDEYLYSVRQLERRIQHASITTDGAPNMAAPTGKPADYGDHVRLMGDLMVLAFQTNATRVCTFMLGIAAGGQTYPMLGIREGHHDLSHQVTDPDARAKLRKIDRYNVSLFAYIVERMKSVQEGDGTLLDNSIVYYGSGLGNGGAHTPFDLPVLVAGRGGGAFGSGQHIKSTQDTPLNNLWVTMLNAMHTPTKSFGDSSGPLDAIMA
ncbi:MAG: DUF1552 domain-containing protein [Pirellulales bacterium]